MLHIKASKKQLSKLRNGHKVRVSPAMKGEGVNLIVHPERYSQITKTFKKNKGVELQLTPDEIMVNKMAHPQMEGSGIFGRDFDNFIEKTIGTQAKDIIYKGADELKPLVKEGISKVADMAPQVGASALSGLAMALGQPELVPIASMAGSQLGSMAGKYGKSFADDYLDNPEKYQGYSDQTGNRDVYAPKTLQGAVEHNEVLQALNKDLGTQYGNLARATLGNLEAQRVRSQNVLRQVRDDAMTRPYITPEYNRTPDRMLPPPPPKAPKRRKKKGKGMEGEGLYAGEASGEGLYAGYGLYAQGRSGCGMYAGGGLKREMSTIGRGGGFVGAGSTLPSALQSQPFSSNFQFRYTLPTQYQQFTR